MSINNLIRQKLKKALTNAEYRKILLKGYYPPYWDEGIHYHSTSRRGFKQPNKEIEHWKVRQYRTWKYNRKTQWKNNSR